MSQRAIAAAVLCLTLITGCVGNPQRRGGAPAAPTPQAADAAIRPDPAAEISRFVAGLDGVGPGYAAAGAAPAQRSVGVSTLLVGNVALIGLDTRTPAATRDNGAPAPGPGSADLGGLPGPAGLPLDDYIHGKVLAQFPQVADVYITTDPALVGRIARVSGRLEAGDAAAAHQQEIRAIARTLIGP